MNEGGPTAMNIPGLVLGLGRPLVVSRPRYTPYIYVAMRIPSPWKVMPAIKIGRAFSAGCEETISDAKVPHNIAGNTGKIQAGVKFWIVMGFPVKRKKYWPTATQNMQAA